jgi:mono/diheme cytochrome c family protein
LSRREQRARRTALLIALALGVLPGCWEQWSESWFPQMKWQRAVQAFERVDFRGQDEAFLPPEGAVPVDGEEPSFERFDPGVDTLANPTRTGDLRSLKRGQQLYASYCQVCHGAGGMGDGPVSMANKRPGPFAGVFPLVTAMSRSDGYIYNLIRNGGGRMPSYRRIADEDRWHLVNYVRYLQKGGQP